MSLKFLTPDSFNINPGTKGYILCCKDTQNLCVVLFYSNKCKYCNSFLGILKEASVRFPNCSFGLINVSNYPQIVEMSNLTIAPIEYVPYIILYINEKPYIRYDGPPTLEDFGSFIQKVLNQMSYQTEFVKKDNNSTSTSTSNNISLPSDVNTDVGIPYNLCQGNKCYFKMDCPSGQ